MKIFSNKNVEGMFDRKKEVITEVLSKWEIYEKKNTVIDLKSELSKMTIQITLEVFFMIKTSPENISEIYNMFRKSTQKINERLERILLAPYWLPTSFNRESWRAQQKVENYVFSLLKEIKSKYGSNKDYIFYDALFDCDKGAYSKKRNKQEMHRLLTYLVTGYKTVATAITWAFYLLMKYPEYEKKLYNEVCACDKICVSRLKELKFLDQIVNETLRVYPPFWLICRKAKRDDEIDGFKIRKGSTVMVSPYLTHRLKEFWTDPERFWPERFDFQQNKKSCLDAFMPFGIGPRTCLGRTFALQEIKLIIMMIMRKFRCEYVSKEQVDAAPLFELTQKGPVKVKLISR